MVYFVQRGDKGPVFIGRSANPQKALARLQQHFFEPLHLRYSFHTADDQQLEEAIHLRLVKLAVNEAGVGWFVCNTTVREMVEELIYLGVDTCLAMWGEL